MQITLTRKEIDKAVAQWVMREFDIQYSIQYKTDYQMERTQLEEYDDLSATIEFYKVNEVDDE